jgi:hypothetical protein
MPKKPRKEELIRVAKELNWHEPQPLDPCKEK